MRPNDRSCACVTLVTINHPGATRGRSILTRNLAAIRPRPLASRRFFDTRGNNSASVLLGTNFIPKMDARISIGIEFLLLGISLDALRGYYRRILICSIRKRRFILSFENALAS